MSTLDRIAEVAAAAEAADGVAPLDEATWLRLRHGRGIRSWVEDGAVATLAGAELNLVVHPERRGQGVGRRVLARVLEEAGDLPLVAWSHADHPAAVRLAAAYDFVRERELWVMRRALADPLPDNPLPDGVHVRGYREDDATEVLRVNAESFADHPEQGAMDADDLAARMAEPWFDPAGLLVVERDGRVVGFHWTKRHSPDLGEVYVVGIDPTVQGIGLGRIATLAGLQHLRDGGATDVLLYVESDNAPAIRVYRDKLGFTHAPRDTHVQYRRTAG